MLPIQPTSSQPGITPALPTKQADQSGSFGKVVADQLRSVNEQQLQADSAVESLVTGQSDDINSVVIQMAKADLTFRMAIEIRNRLIESYQEIMRMQV